MFDMLVFMSWLSADGYIQCLSLVILAKARGHSIVQYGSKDQFMEENNCSNSPIELKKVQSHLVLALYVQDVLVYKDYVLRKTNSQKTKFWPQASELLEFCVNKFEVVL